MTYCPSCGTEVAESASFCESCGTDIGGIDSSPDETSEIDEPIDESSASVEVDGGINWRHAVKSTLIGFLPAFGAYMMISLATNSTAVPALLIAIPLFGYLLYKRPSAKAMLGGATFWLAVEAFLSPVVMLVYTATFTAQETSTEAGEAGAAIGGGILMIMAFVVGLPVGIVLYLLSRRLDVDSENYVEASPQTA